MKKLMWLEKGIINHNTMKWVWYLVGVVKLWTWFVVAPKISFEKLATMDYPPYLVQFPNSATTSLSMQTLALQKW